MHFNRLWSALALAGLMLASPAFAQDESQMEPAEEPPPEDYVEAEEAPPTPVEAAEEAPPAEEPEAAPEEPVEDEPVEQNDTSPRELEDTDYFFLGAFARGIIIPGFIQGLFVDGGIDGFNPGVGLEFTYRRNNFSLVVNGWWNNAVADGYFRANGDPLTDTEYIDVDLGVIFLNATFLWAFPVDDEGIFAIELGFDLGFGVIFGELVRTEATPDGDGYRPCTGPGDGSPGYCEPPAPDPCYNTNGGHYNCSEPNWTTDGGDTPLLFPWVTLPHVAVRIKPIRQVQIRIDGGYGLYNFFFGGSVAYGF
ncbi:MAG: hypothetical protein AB8I08_39710 [Sandaracinaceae bacterium]